jgi:membrane protease YdiL (CAAX protease family)
VLSLLRFFLLTFALSWTCFAAAPALPGVMATPILYVGVFAPAIVGLGLMRWEGGMSGLEDFFARRFQWASSWRWFLFAVGYYLAIKLVVVLMHRGISGAWPRFGTDPWYLLAVALVFSTPVQAGEEIGWRGYALPRLESRFGLGWASVVLGVIWAVWHLPLFFIPSLDYYGQSFLIFALGCMSISVAMAWLYAHTNRSVLMTMLMHSAVNQTTGIVPSAVVGAGDSWAMSHSLVAWLSVALLWACAGYFLMRMARPVVAR